MMEFGFWNPLVKSIFRLVKWWMQKVDYEAAQKVDFFIANSKTTAERIRKYYDRDAEIIYPGIDESQFQISDVKGDFYFGMGRCIPYKKFDLLVDAFNANGKKLILATNTDNLLYRELREKSGANIEWRFAPSITERNTLYVWAKAFLFPPEEDFGLVPVEAMISGTPVIAYGKWGGMESVIDGETGIFFTLQTPEALNSAIEKFETMKWDREKIRKRGIEFSKEKFQENIRNFVKRHAQ
jgi:glycosyltransferase involved in cell wall biosynthesis